MAAQEVISLDTLPASMPQRVRLTTLLLALVADEGSGEVPGGLGTVNRLLGYSGERSTRRILAECEAWGYVRRVGHNPTRVLIALGKLNADTCDICGGPAKLGRVRRTRGEPARCHGCYQTVGRGDRSWRSKALATWINAMAAGLTEAQIVYRVHAVTRMPLYSRASGGVADPATTAIVPWMVQEGLIASSWLIYNSRAQGRSAAGILGTPSEGEVPEDTFEG